MDLSTNYLGFRLSHPIVPGASPLADSLDGVRRLEDATAPMITLPSLFEEQFENESSAIPDPSDPWRWQAEPQQYIEHLQQVKTAVKIPVIASLNGTTNSTWLDYAKQIEEAGADALELNIYKLPTNPLVSGAALEEEVLSIVATVRNLV